MGEWFALPLIEEAERTGDVNAFEEIFHPVAERVLARCDACLRIGGASAGADRMVFLVEARPEGAAALTPGLPVDVVPLGGAVK